MGTNGERGDRSGDPLPRPGHEDQDRVAEEEAVQHLRGEGS